MSERLANLAAQLNVQPCSAQDDRMELAAANEARLGAAHRKEMLDYVGPKVRLRRFGRHQQHGSHAHACQAYTASQFEKD